MQYLWYANIIYRTHWELYLLDYDTVKEFFERERPDYVFLAAANVDTAKSLYVKSEQIINIIKVHLNLYTILSSWNY